MENKFHALTSFKKTLEMQQKSLLFYHSLMIVTHIHLAIVLEDLQLHTEAVEHVKQAIHIASDSLDAMHPQIQVYEEYLNHVRDKQ